MQKTTLKISHLLYMYVIINLTIMLRNVKHVNQEIAQKRLANYQKTIKILGEKYGR